MVTKITIKNSYRVMFFDSLFCRFLKRYSDKEKGAESSAAGFVGLVLTFDFLFALLQYNFYVANKSLPFIKVAIAAFVFFRF